MSGPGLDHAVAWMRSRRVLQWARLRPLLRQTVRSWYTALFQIPRVAELASRTVVPRAFTRYLRRVEGVPAGVHPAPTLSDDGAHGVQLYRQNIPRRMANPRPRSTEVPVLLIVPTRDRFVTSALLDDTREYASELRRIDVEGGHWFPVAHPDEFAAFVRDHVVGVEARRG